MKLLERNLRRVDAFQQRHGPLAFLFALSKKFGDDNGGNGRDGNSLQHLSIS